MCQARKKVVVSFLCAAERLHHCLIFKLKEIAYLIDFFVVVESCRVFFFGSFYSLDPEIG
jgi:hypothetical protein